MYCFVCLLFVFSGGFVCLFVCLCWFAFICCIVCLFVCLFGFVCLFVCVCLSGLARERKAHQLLLACITLHSTFN